MNTFYCIFDTVMQLDLCCMWASGEIMPTCPKLLLIIDMDVFLCIIVFARVYMYLFFYIRGVKVMYNMR